MLAFRLIQKAAIILLVLALTGCATQNVNWDYNPDKTLANFKTYAWLEPSEAEQSTGYKTDALIDQRIHNAVNRVLQQRGYRQLVPPNNAQADFLVSYFTSVKTRYEEHQVTTSLGYGYGYWGMGGTTDLQVQDYEEATLVINVVDPKSKKVLWSGSYKARLQDNLSPQERIKRIDEQVAAILTGFPRPPEK